MSPHESFPFQSVDELLAKAQGLDVELHYQKSLDDLFDFKILDLYLTHSLYLEAIREYLEKGGRSRGSFLVLDPGGTMPCESHGENWKFSLNPKDSFVDSKILEISLYKNISADKKWVNIRPIPQVDGWFERVWNDYMNDKIVK
jgi:hypothetical protein